MKQSSLEIAREVIIKALDESNIDQVDKCEIMLNITKFLNEKTYDKNIKILSKTKKRR